MSVGKKRTLVVRDPRKVRALRTPARQEILETLVRLGACSVKELAGQTGRAPASLYYHIHELTGAGLIREAERRRSGRRLESVYEPVADRIVLDRKERSRAFVSALADLHRSTLRKTERELVRALDPKRSREAPPGESVSLLRLTARLRPRAATKARRMLRELVEFIGDNDDPSAPDTYALTAALVRLAPPDTRALT